MAESFFKQNYCHACHTRFAVIFPLPSCGVGSLLRIDREGMMYTQYMMCVVQNKRSLLCDDMKCMKTMLLACIVTFDLIGLLPTNHIIIL